MRALRMVLALLLVACGIPAPASGGAVIFADGFESGDVSAWSAAPGWICQDEGALMQNLVIAGLPNSLEPDVVTITAGAEGSANLAAKLKTLEPWDFARLTSVFPHESYWEVDFGSAPLANVRALALGGHTLVPGDQVRVVGVESGSLPPVRSETLAPTAIEASSNASGAVTNVDEHPSSPDSTYIGPPGGSEGTPWSVRLSFGAPASDPATGTNCQAFVLYVRRGATPSAPDDYPTMTVSLYESGVLVEELGTKVVSIGDPGQVLIFTWTADGLSSPDGSGVEVLIESTPGSDDTSAALDAISWEVLHQSDADAADADTGWHTIAGAEPSAAWGGTAIQEVDLPPPLWHTFLPAAVGLVKVRFEIRADGVGYFNSFLRTPPRTPAEAIDAGYLIVSSTWEVPYNFAPGARLRNVPTYVGGQTALSGSNRTVVQYRTRDAEVDLTLREDEAAVLFERLDYSGAGRPFLLAMQPGSTGTVARNATFLATAEATGHVFERAHRGGQTTRSARYLFTERL